MDRRAWWAAVHGVARSQTRLSDFTLFFHFHALEKEMATHSSVLAWRIPGTGNPGGLASMGSHRVGHDWSYLAAASSFRLVFSIHLRVGSRIMFRTLGLVGRLGSHLENAFSKWDFVAMFLYGYQFISISHDYIQYNCKSNSDTKY